MVEETEKAYQKVGNQVLQKTLVFVVLWSGLFTLAYAQSPLYTSNQNQYFLQGLANVGFGYLDQDWLANTLDPTPVFSWLVEITYRILPWPPIFYIYFGILAGVMFFSLFSIFNGNLLQKSDPKSWFTLIALLLINSAAVRFLVVRVAGTDWAYLFDGGVAGQRLLGSILQPSAFGVFFLLSIYLFLRKKTYWAIIPLIIAPTIHPTYLLSAAVLTLIYMGLELKEKKQLRPPLLTGILTLVGIIPILIHTILTFGGTSPDLLSRGRELLVEFRIPHHAIPAEWFDTTVIIKVIIILFGIILTRKTRLYHILLWSFSAAVIGTLLQIAFNSDFLALLFPWRLSTWLVPLSMTAIVFRAVDHTWPWIEKRVPKGITIITCVGLTIILTGFGLTKSILEARGKNTSSDRSMMAYVAENKSAGNEYLIPLDMQDFRLVTGAPVYVEFKSIPYKDVEVIEWYQRLSKAGRLYRAPRKRDGCEIVAELRLEGVTHIVLPYDHTIRTCPNLEKEYSDANYALFRITGD